MPKLERDSNNAAVFALKIIAAVTILVSLALRTAMDFFWKDGRTNRHKKVRAGFILTAFVAALMNVIVIWVDEVQKQIKSELNEARTTEIDNVSLGALTPDIAIQLHSDPGFPENPMIPGVPLPMPRIGPASSNDPPGTIVVLISNTNTFPIYDLTMWLWHDLAHPGQMSKVMEEFNKEGTKTWPIIHPSKVHAILLPMESGLTESIFKFVVRTRRGSTEHVHGLVLRSNRWEFIRSVMDITHQTNRVLLYDISAQFPRDANDEPVVPVVTRIPLVP